jgi:membrane fusion protein (multidrug efflux system)
MREISTKVIIAAVGVAVVLAAGGWHVFGPDAKPKVAAVKVRQVLVGVVKRQRIGDRIEAIGTLSANESVTVTAKTQGIIRSLNFDDGQTVRKGEEIAAIDAGEQDAALNVEMANLDQQRKDLARVEGLAQSRNVSQARVDEQVAALRKAEANVAAARVRSGDRRITAPFSGIVGTRRISVGALVSPGTAIAVLDDISVVKLDFAVPETFLAALKPGLDVEATSVAYPGETFKGKIVAVDSRIDPATRSVNIRAILPNDEIRLRPGMLMVVDLIKNVRDALLVPEAAVMPENEVQYVYIISNVAGAEAIATRTVVKLGVRQVGMVELLEGVKEGDVVITEGGQDLRSGAKVRVVNAADKMTAPAP